MKKILLTLVAAICLASPAQANDGPYTWTTSLSNAGQIWALAVDPVSPAILYAGSNTTGIWKSTNRGLNWTQSNSGLSNLTVQALAIAKSDPRVLFCGTSQTGSGAGIYRSTDAGSTWTLVNNGIVETSIGIQSIAVDPANQNTAYVAVFDGLVDSPQGLYKTTNGGANWTPANSGIGTIKNFLTIAINPLNPNVIYAGSSFQVNPQTGPSKIYKSVNGATSWTESSSGLPSLTTDVKPIRCISISNVDTSRILIGLFLNTDSLGGMFLTTNGGAQWVRRHTGIPNAIGTLIRSCAIRPGSTKEFIAGLGNSTNTGIGIFRTTNEGLSWSSFNNGTMNNTISVRALAFSTRDDTTLFAGAAHPTVTSGQGVMEYTWTPPTSIENNNQLPIEFSLGQNRPNPFNPSTMISYRIQGRSFVDLSIFDITGKEVMTLVNEIQDAGTYEIRMDGSGLPSGSYICRLRSDQGIRSKTMLLIK